MKKGFSLVELIISIVLLTIVLLFMLGLLIRLNSKKEDASDLGILVDQAIITKKINGDILNLEGIESVNCDATSCLIVFGIGQTKYISLSVDKKTLTYGTISEIEIAKTLPEDYEYDLVTLSNNYYSDIKLTKIVISVKDNPKYNIEVYASKEIQLVEGDVFNFAYTGNVQTFTVPEDGLYKVELWGAQGGDYLPFLGGKGGYTSGQINLTQSTNLYLFVGGFPGTSESGGWNGGGALIAGQSVYGRSGGGATDIRVTSTNKYRYIRDYINGSTANTGNHWVEIKALDINGNNVALNKTVTSDGTLTSSNLVVDGSTPAPAGGMYTYISETGLHYIEIDLGAEYSLNSIQVWHYYDGRTYYNTRTVLYNAARTINETVFDSAVSGTYTETQTGRFYVANTASIRSRIMVAGGGGGANNRNYNDTSCGYGQGGGGEGGNTTGGIGITIGHTYNGCTYGWGVALGGSQTSGGLYNAYNSAGALTGQYLNSGFGYGGGPSQSGGGGGYYGGGMSGHGGAGGGSSFISGHTGCNAVNSSGVHTGLPDHYSGNIFSNTVMIDGNSTMPNIYGVTETGHSGNGYAKITQLIIE